MRDRPARVRIERLGEAALLGVVGKDVDPALNALVHRAAAALRARRPRLEGLGEPVPGYASLLAPFDPARVDERVVRAALLAAFEAARPADDEVGAAITIPVRYGGLDGPDLADVASRTGLDEADVVRLHASTEYRVFCVGFMPGFAYLGVLPEVLELPRRPMPRVRVPAGSVAIAGRQSGVYPATVPGGWHVIGRTDLPAWDPERDPPALLSPGDRVRFEPV